MIHPAGKNIFLILLLLLAVQTSFSQGRDLYDDTSSSARHFPDYVVELKVKNNNPIPAVYFGKVFIRDARPDNLKMGFANLEVKGPVHKLVFPEPAESYLSKKLGGAIHVDSLFDSLCVVLKDLWFNQTRTKLGFGKNKWDSPEESISNCFMKADIFIRQAGQYRYAGPVDTVLSAYGWVPNRCNKLLEETFRAALAKADLLCASVSPATPGIDEKNFSRLVADKNKYPVLSANPLHKGVYFSFNDFINDTPAAIRYISGTEQNWRTLTYKSAGDTTEDRAWGFSDGTDVYMHLDKRYYRLLKRDQTFEVVAPETIEIANTFGGKALTAVVDYFFIFKDLASSFFDLLGPSRTYQTRLKKYYLDLLNGRLR